LQKKSAEGSSRATHFTFWRRHLYLRNG